MPPVPFLKKAVKGVAALYVHVHHPEPFQDVDVSAGLTPIIEVNNPPPGATLHLEVVHDGAPMPYLPPGGAFSFPLVDPLAIYTVFGLDVPANPGDLVLHVWVQVPAGVGYRTYRKAVPFQHVPAVVEEGARKAVAVKATKPRGKKKP